MLLNSCSPILVVEDDEPIRTAIVDFLRMEGFICYFAENGKAALHRLTEIPHPCLILLDLFMPVMDGLDFLRELKKEHQDWIVTLPIVIVSAGAPQSEVVKAALPFASGFVKKPIDLDVLLRLINKYCSKS